jgi:hypothetical protein
MSLEDSLFSFHLFSSGMADPNPTTPAAIQGINMTIPTTTTPAAIQEIILRENAAIEEKNTEVLRLLRVISETQGDWRT